MNTPELGERTPDPLDNWELLQLAHFTTRRRVEEALMGAVGLTLSQYQALAALVEAHNNQLRMTELAAKIILTRSGATRVVYQLGLMKLLRRAAATDDGRGIVAILTEEGRHRFHAGTGSYSAAVRQAYSPITRTEQEMMADAFRHLCCHDAPSTGHLG